MYPLPTLPLSSIHGISGSLRKSRKKEAPQPPAPSRLPLPLPLTLPSPRVLWEPKTIQQVGGAADQPPFLPKGGVRPTTPPPHPSPHGPFCGRCFEQKLQKEVKGTPYTLLRLNSGPMTPPPPIFRKSPLQGPGGRVPTSRGGGLLRRHRPSCCP